MSFMRNLQSFIKAHFTRQWLADPVDEGFGLFCSVRTAAAHQQFHHFSLSILKNNIKQLAKNPTEEENTS